MDYRAAKSRGTDSAWYQGWGHLTEEKRAVFRATTIASQEAKRKSMRGDAVGSDHPINTPRLDPAELMPRLPRTGLRTLSLFSGGGGLDIGFERAGFDHVANYEIMSGAAEVLRAAHPDWKVFGGAEGDVTAVKWSAYRGLVDVLHGGPPCQPFSHAGRRQGAEDARDMIPAMVKAIKAIQPAAFVLENVTGLLTKRFEPYIQSTILKPLAGSYHIKIVRLEAPDFGVPQKRRRVFFVGFRDTKAAAAFNPPQATHSAAALSSGETAEGLIRTMGVREALGLPGEESHSLFLSQGRHSRVHHTILRPPRRGRPDRRHRHHRYEP